MSDVFSIIQGNLYDPGQGYDYWYLVVSNNNYNKDNNTIICCFVKLYDSTKDLNNTDIVFDYNGIQYKIIVDCITNHYSKKLTRYQYKGTLAGDLIVKVLDKIKFMLGFDNLFTLDEARKILAEREIELKAKYGAYASSNKRVVSAPAEPEPKIESIITPPKSSNIKLSRDDEQKAFARQMANIPFSDNDIEVVQKTLDPTYIEPEKIHKAGMDAAKKQIEAIKSKKRVTTARNNLVYDDLEQFVEDYQNQGVIFVLDKYHIRDKKSLDKLVWNIKHNHPEAFNKKKKIEEKPKKKIKKATPFCLDFILDYYNLSDKELISKYHLENTKTAVRNAIYRAKYAYVRQGGDLEDLKDIINSGNRKRGGKKKEALS